MAFLAYSKIMGLVLINALTSGTVTGAELETELANASIRSGWQWAIGNQTRVEALAQDAAGSAAMAASATALADVADNADALNTFALYGPGIGAIVSSANFTSVFTGGSGRHTRLETAAGQASSKLKRQLFTGSGTWTKPATLRAIAVLVIGGGGGGGGSYNNSSASNYAGSGGGGGETKAIKLDPAAVTGNVTVTIGGGGGGGGGGGSWNSGVSAGGTTSFGAHLSAAGGAAGNFGYDTWAAGVAGGTSATATGSLLNIPQGNITLAKWISETIVKAGAASGGTNSAGGSLTKTCANGTATNGGTGGSIGAWAPQWNGGGGGSSLYGNGGNGGGSGTAGSAGGSYGGGGGSGTNGAAGAAGACLVMWVED